MNFTMDRDAGQRQEGAVVGYEEQKKNRGSFAVEILVASLERNSHQAQVQIFFLRRTREKPFFSHTFFPYGYARLSFTAWSNSCEQDTLLYLPQSMPSIRFDISLSAGGNVDGESR